MKPINNLPRKTFFKEQLGNLKNLTTNIKTDLVGAINWLHGFLLNKLGDTDISAIGDGTVTGAISQVNNDLDKKAPRNNPTIHDPTIIFNFENDSGLTEAIFRKAGGTDDTKGLAIVTKVNGTSIFNNLINSDGTRNFVVKSDLDDLKERISALEAKIG